MSPENTQPKVCLFFTDGMSLAEWQRAGLLDREVQLYLKLAQKGAAVSFLTYGTEAEEQPVLAKIPGIQVLPLYARAPKPQGKWPKLGLSLVAGLFFFDSLRKVSLFKTNQLRGGWAAVVAAICLRKPLLVRCGFEYYHFALHQKKSRAKLALIWLVSKWVYKSASRIVVTSPFIREFIIRQFGIEGRKITVIPNFIEHGVFAPPVARPLPSQAPIQDRVLFVGRLNPQKNLEALIEACGLAKVGLDIIGKGDMQPGLEQWAQRCGANVRFLGVFANHELPGQIAQYGIFVLPSHFEGNPKTLLEAMACQRLVIGADADGIRDVIQHGVTGLIAQGEAKSLAERIQSARSNPAEMDRMGIAARQWVVENCSLDRVADREMAVYRELLN